MPLYIGDGTVDIKAYLVMMHYTGAALTSLPTNLYLSNVEGKQDVYMKHNAPGGNQVHIMVSKSHFKVSKPTMVSFF